MQSPQGGADLMIWQGGSENGEKSRRNTGTREEGAADSEGAAVRIGRYGHSAAGIDAAAL